MQWLIPRPCNQNGTMVDSVKPNDAMVDIVKIIGTMVDTVKPNDAMADIVKTNGTMVDTVKPNDTMVHICEQTERWLML